jgi:hypothetical protein
MQALHLDEIRATEGSQRACLRQLTRTLRPAVSSTSSVVAGFEPCQSAAPDRASPGLRLQFLILSLQEKMDPGTGCEEGVKAAAADLVIAMMDSHMPVRQQGTLRTNLQHSTARKTSDTSDDSDDVPPSPARRLIPGNTSPAVQTAVAICRGQWCLAARRLASVVFPSAVCAQVYYIGTTSHNYRQTFCQPRVYALIVNSIICT